MQQVDNKKRFVVFGDNNVGKYTFVNKFNNADNGNISFDKNSVFSTEKEFYENEEAYTIELTTISYSFTSECMLESIYRNADGYFILFSLNNHISFDLLITFIQKIQRLQDIEMYPTIIIGTKLNLTNERQISEEEINEFCSLTGFQYYKISLINDNINNIIQQLLKNVINYKIPNTIRANNKKCKLM